ncbi:hypothetical protein HGRIS_006109 [Hohenbuehelia grisea]|uniref:F-box domain-containing protein n=1 Tax=Hohenbuehelia grisea TaxID=104357 RepID=A0ABR3JZ67_9AGAR
MFLTDTDERGFLHLVAYGGDQFAPSQELLPEILSVIFEIVVADVFESTVSKDSPRQMLALTAVCRHWRDVALATPMLWGYLFCDVSPQWVEQLLRRSKSSPLRIRSAYQYVGLDADLHHLEACSKFALLCEESSRIHQLWLESGQDTDLVMSLLQNSMPNLHSLRLRSSTRTPRLPAALFEATPSLRELVLVRFEVSYKALSSLSNLRTLKLHSIPAPDTDDLLCALRGMPLLETLAMSIIDLDGPMPGAALRAKEVELSHLTSLDIIVLHSDDLPMEYFLERIICKNLAAIGLALVSSSPISVTLASTIAAKCYHLIKNTPGHLYADITLNHHASELRLCPVTEVVNSNHGPDRRNCPIIVRCTMDGPDMRLSSKLSGMRLIQALPQKSSVLSLGIGGDNVLTEHQWRTTFNGFRHIQLLRTDSLTRLGIQDGTLSALGPSFSAERQSGDREVTQHLAAGHTAIETSWYDESAIRHDDADILSKKPESGHRASTQISSTPGTEYLFPRLRQLVLCNWYFKVTPLVEGSLHILDRLMHSLSAWKDGQIAVETLTIQRGRHLTSEDVEKLKGCVQTVEWDRVEILDDI